MRSHVTKSQRRSPTKIPVKKFWSKAELSSAELTEKIKNYNEVAASKVNPTAWVICAGVTPQLEPPICHRLTLLTATCALLRHPVARLICCELIAIHPGRGFSHDRGLVLSPSKRFGPTPTAFPQFCLGKFFNLLQH